MWSGWVCVLQLSQVDISQPIKQLVGMPQSMPVQFLVVQSAATMHMLPSAQGAQLPPQFVSVSSPSIVVLAQ